MAYVSGFVAPVKTARKSDYLAMAERTWAIFQDYGALETRECWGDDVPAGEVTSFPRAVQAADDETVVLSWIVWPDKASAEACFAAMESDARWSELDMGTSGANMKRMFWGGFETLMHAPA
jgi:uncharacterized protein YbaA (DUF1428 family)